MSFALVPRGITTEVAAIWVGAIGERVDGRDVVVRGAGPDQRVITWQSVAGIHFAVVTVRSLEPRRTYPLALVVDGRVAVTGSVTTLPRVLPAFGSKPFTVLLASCFARLHDEAGDVGHTFAQLPGGAEPDVKILCGDQVYLDSPASYFLLRRSEAALAQRFLEHYARTWTQHEGSEGFAALLRHGANYFTSDDHEFWNNAPNAASYAMNTWTEDGRRRWMTLARALLTAFQLDEPVTRFDTPPLTFFLADTRVNRTSDRTRFMDPQDLQRLTAWLAGLEGPGVLVLGQPVLTETHGFLGNFLDWGLADYQQYADLVRALAACQHSVVVLTGDVHFGRIARCALRAGGELIEVIASPLALVDARAGGRWSAAPSLFPAIEIPGVVQSPVTTEPFTSTAGHFLTLEFSALGHAVQLQIKNWPIVGAGVGPASTIVLQRRLR